jgi:hypothetical protein
MTQRKALPILITALAILMLAGCGSSSDIFGGGSGYPSSSTATIRGTVDSVDLNNHSILLTNTSGYNSMLSSSGSGGGSSVRVYYDDQTRVDFNGRSYRPENLERGDQVDVHVNQSGNRLLADNVTVTYNANASSTYPGSTYPSGSGSYGTMVSGTVRYVDASRRTIEIDRGSGNNVIVDFDNSTSVMYGNQSYRPTDLQNGDQVDIRGRDLGSGRFLATSVDVVRSVSGNNNGTYGSSSNRSTVRGTVRSIDTNNRTIELEQANWTSGFAPGNRSSNVLVVHYDPGARIDVQGQLSPIENLERGDVVDVQVRDGNTSNLLAQRITLVRNVRQ